MSASVNDRDLGLNKILKEIKKFEGAIVKAGILEGSGSVDGVSIAQYATWNENGVAGKKGKWKIPPRPFIKGWVANNQKQIASTIQRLYGEVASGNITADEALKRLGVFAKSGIQSYIKRGDFVPNAPSTIRKKGSSKPLIDSGAMRNAVNYEVER